MSRWHLSAEGDAPEGAQQELAARLRKLLRLVKFGTDTSQFSGGELNGPVHEKALADDSDQGDDDSDE